MADYKIALELYQSQAGGENAKVRISINDVTVADNVEVSNTDSENPTLFVYDAIGLPDPGPDATTSVKVTLLNDYYVDVNNDRNINWGELLHVLRRRPRGRQYTSKHYRLD